MKGTTLVLALCCASISCAGGYLTFGVKNGQGDAALKAARSLGADLRNDGYEGIYSLRIRSDAELSAAKRKLASLKGVLFVRESRPVQDLGTTDTLSVAELRSTLSELKARNRDRERMAAHLGRKLEKIEKVKTGYWESHLYWLEERAYPRDRIDLKAYDRGVIQRAQMAPAFGASGDSIGVGPWQFVGPTNLDIPYTTYYGVRPINGRGNAIAVDPSNPNTLYLGSAQGGVWKSTNGGATWTPLNDNWTYMTTSSIAIDPSSPQTIYVGTGDYPGSKPYQMGIMKSIDGGATWTQLGASTFGGRAISWIAIDPDTPSTITVATGRGSTGSGFIYRSTNGGLSWSTVLGTSANWSQISIGANNAGVRVYYCSGSGSAGGNVWRSLDRGATWTKLTTLASNSTHSVISVCASPVFPDTVYMVANADRKVFKSTDRGATWVDTTGAFPNGSNNYFWSQSTYNWFLNVSSKPGPQDVIYVGMIDAVQSYDGGATWRSIGGPCYSSSAVTHNDQHFCVTDPTNPNRVYIGGDGGAYRYDFNPSTNAGTWGYLSANLGITQFYKADFHPTNPNYMIGGTQDNATPVAVGSLANWENCGGGDGGFCAINPNNTAIQYCTSQNLNIYRTGNTWSSQSTINPTTTGDSVAFIAPIVLDPNNSNLLYAGTNYLYRRNDSGGAWTNRLGGQLLSATGNLRAIAVAPGDTNRIYTGASDGQVWMSTNQGANWTQINTGSPGLPNRVINYIAVNPANKNDILVSCSGTGAAHLWRCADTTATVRVWQDVDGSGATGVPDVPANTICRDYFDFDNTWFIGNDLGCFVTENGGATWQNATQPLGLPNTQVNDLKVQPLMNTLHAATYGRGMWRLNLPPVFNPSSIAAISGTPAGGGVNEILTSNDAYYNLQCDEGSPNGEVEIIATSPLSSVSELAIALETSATRTAIGQSVSLFDWNALSYVQVDYRIVQLTDSRYILRVTNSPSRFLNGSRQLRLRIKWVPNTDVEDADGWAQRIDRCIFRAVP